MSETTNHADNSPSDTLPANPLRVAIFDDKEQEAQHIAQIVEGYGMYWGRPVTVTVGTDRSAIDRFLDESKGSCPADFILADVFMPERACTQPVEHGGAWYLYRKLDACIRSGKIDPEQVLLIAISSYWEISCETVRKINQAQNQPEYVSRRWALTSPKPMLDGGLDQGRWSQFLHGLMARYAEQTWRRSVGMLHIAVGRRYHQAFQEATNFVERLTDRAAIISGPPGSGRDYLAMWIAEQRTLRVRKQPGGDPRIVPVSVSAHPHLNDQLVAAITSSLYGTLLLTHLERFEQLSQDQQDLLTQLIKHAQLGGGDRQQIILPNGIKLDWQGLVLIEADLDFRLPNMFVLGLPRIVLPELAATDVAPLVDTIIDKELERLNSFGARKLPRPSVDPAAMEELESFDWPGANNVAGLAAAVKHLLRGLTPGQEIKSAAVSGVLASLFQPATGKLKNTLERGAEKSPDASGKADDRRPGNRMPISVAKMIAKKVLKRTGWLGTTKITAERIGCSVGTLQKLISKEYPCGTPNPHFDQEIANYYEEHKAMRPSRGGRRGVYIEWGQLAARDKAPDVVAAENDMPQHIKALSRPELKAEIIDILQRRGQLDNQMKAWIEDCNDAALQKVLREVEDCESSQQE